MKKTRKNEYLILKFDSVILYFSKDLKCLRMNRTRKYTRLGDLSAAVGWNKQEVLSNLEDKRKERASEYFQRKVKLVNAVKKQAMNLPDVKKLRSQLEKLGY